MKAYPWTLVALLGMAALGYWAGWTHHDLWSQGRDDTHAAHAPLRNSEWFMESQRYSTDAPHAPYTNDGSECLDRLREVLGYVPAGACR